MLSWFLIAVIVAALLWFRFAPSDPSVWHKDPAIVQKTAKPNQFLMRDGGDAAAEIFDISPAKLATAFHKVAMSQPRVSVLTEADNDYWITYVQRSKLMGYPDYISIRIEPVDANKSALLVYSRSRFGRSDLGVNKARVKDWLGQLRNVVAR
ncbi:DUF1499 domain-containing protein [Neptunicoccus cionae]|uniref:DUF1499 domain-containing protein n=1 Tax=Neptunicoccus cionae TaxID=2035344 RepID=A0A916VR91_9RHOB|nr:DUF1499 domain-containing protein [Amylibacter cionae]GGA24810.1 hypothetical protein GCM10011498_27270 [Amylibacter cionae]